MITLYTDGSCPRNPGPGGWAFCVVEQGCILHKAGGGVSEATNNTMELQAAIEGLEYVVRQQWHKGKLVLISDSQYVVRGVTRWVAKWVRDDWMRTAQGRGGRQWRQEVANKAQWQKLYQLTHHTCNVEMRWERGHIGNEFNELCDKLAGEHAWQMIESL